MTFISSGENKIIVGVSGVARKNQSGEPIGYFLGFFDLTEIENRDELVDQLNSFLIMEKLTK